MTFSLKALFCFFLLSSAGVLCSVIVETPTPSLTAYQEYTRNLHNQLAAHLNAAKNMEIILAASAPTKDANGNWGGLKCAMGQWLDGETCIESKLGCMDNWSAENLSCHNCP